MRIRRLANLTARGAHIRSSRSDRQALATVWVIMLAPLLLGSICLAVDIGMVSATREELSTAVQSAAKQAVITWAGGGTTTQARTAAQTVATANGYSLNANENLANPNGNDSCTGDIVLGSMDPTNSTNFNASGDPGCNRSRNYNIDVTFQTPAGQTTVDTTSAFLVEYTSGDAGVSIASISINLAGGGDDGIFDLNPAGALGDETGMGPVIGTNGTNIPDGSISFSPNSNTTSTTLTVTFPTGGTDATAFDAGESFSFGADTDGVGSGPPPPANALDKGGSFGTGAGANNPGVTMTINFSNGDSLVLLPGDVMRLGPNNASLTGNLNITIDDEDFAAHVQKSTTVTGIASSVIGNGNGMYTISAQATAVGRCSGGSARLVTEDSFTCP